VGNTLLKINVKKENSLHNVMDSYDKNISTYFKKLDVYISTYISEIAKCETLNLKKIKGFHELRDLLYKIDYFAYAKYLSINCEIKLREAISNYLNGKISTKDIELVSKYMEKNVTDNSFISSINNATYKSGNFDENEIAILTEIANMKTAEKELR
jgi:hypothetical protein